MDSIHSHSLLTIAIYRYPFAYKQMIRIGAGRMFTFVASIKTHIRQRTGRGLAEDWQKAGRRLIESW